MSTLIVTTGTRDLQIKQDFVEQTGKNPMSWRSFPIKQDPSGYEEGASGLVFERLREATTQLIKRKQEYTEAILAEVEYPIVRSAIEYVIDSETKIEQLIFVVTNQPDGTPDRFRGADTKFVAPILRKLAERDFPTKIISYRTFEIGCAPVDTDAVTTWLDERWGTFADQFPEPVYLMTQTGVANLKLMLFMRCLERYPGLRYLTKPKGERFAREDNLPYRFRTNYYNQQIRSALKIFRYSDILSLPVHQEVVLNATYAYAMLAFNFEEAQQAINSLRRIYRDHLDFYNILYEYLRDVKSDLTLKVLNMYQAARFSYLQHNYAGFLIRLFALSESIAKPAVEDIIGVSTQFDPKGEYAAWREAISQPQFQSLVQKCENSSQGKNGLNPYEPTFRVMLKVLEWQTEQNGEEDPFLKIGSSILNLRDMRNLIAHGLDGVGPTDIEKKLPKKGLKASTDPYPATEAFLNQMKGYFFQKKVKNEYINLFDTLNQHILACIS